MAFPWGPNASYVYLQKVEGQGISGDYTGIVLDGSWWKVIDIGYRSSVPVYGGYFKQAKVIFLNQDEVVAVPGDTLSVYKVNLLYGTVTQVNFPVSDSTATKVYCYAEHGDYQAWSTDVGFYLWDVVSSSVVYQDVEGASYSCGFSTCYGVEAVYGINGKLRRYDIAQGRVLGDADICGVYVMAWVLPVDDRVVFSCDSSSGGWVQIFVYGYSSVTSVGWGIYSEYGKSVIKVTPYSTAQTNLNVSAAVKYNKWETISTNVIGYLQGANVVYPANMYAGAIIFNDKWMVNYDWGSGLIYVIPDVFDLRIKFTYSGAIDYTEWEHATDDRFDLTTGEATLRLDQLADGLPSGVIAVWNGVG